MQKQLEHSFCQLQLLVFSKFPMQWRFKLMKRFDFYSAQSDKNGVTHLTVNLPLLFLSLPACLHSTIPNPTIHALSIHSSINQHSHLLIFFTPFSNSTTASQSFLHTLAPILHYNFKPWISHVCLHLYALSIYPPFFLFRLSGSADWFLLPSCFKSDCMVSECSPIKVPHPGYLCTGTSKGNTFHHQPDSQLGKFFCLLTQSLLSC